MAVNPRIRTRGSAAPSVHEDIMEVRFARMSERYEAFTSEFSSFATSVSTTFADIRTSLTDLSKEVKDRGRSNWPVLTGFGVLILGVVGALGQITYGPLTEADKQQTASIIRTNEKFEAAISRVIDGTLSQREFSTYAQNAKERRDDQNKALTDRLDRLGIFLSDLQKSTVSTERYNEAFRAEQIQDAAVQRQIDTLNATVSNIYNPRDALARLERRNDELEALVSGLQAKVATQQGK